MTVGISQGAVAGQIKVETSTVSHWETGKTQPSLSSLLSYLEALGLELVLQPKMDDAEKILGSSSSVSELGCL